jgi:hypothetical protein
MTMGVDDMNDAQPVIGQTLENAVGLVAGVDDHGLACLLTPQDETVGLNGA